MQSSQPDIDCFLQELTDTPEDYVKKIFGFQNANIRHAKEVDVMLFGFNVFGADDVVDRKSYQPIFSSTGEEGDSVWYNDLAARAERLEK